MNPATRRETHLDEALDCIDYRKYDEACHLYNPEGIHVVAECPQFVITSLKLKDAARVSMDDFKSCLVYSCLSGGVKVTTGGADYSLTAGETLLVPATCDNLLLTPAPGGVHLLQTHLPQPPKDDVYDGPELP